MQPTTPSSGNTAEYKFNCNKAMFGELYGESLAPTRCVDNRVYLSLQCRVYRNNIPLPEQYTLSVGHNEVQQILVYFGRAPSFIAIETSPRFAEVACQRIGQEVLVPGSPDPKKRYIILALLAAFKLDTEASEEIHHLKTCITPWAQMKVLTWQAAHKLIAEASLDVDQKELLYGVIETKFNKLVFDYTETVLLYKSACPFGNMRVTTNDVNSLREGAYVNDIIIDFYLRYLYDKVLTPRQRWRTYIFNSYFYKALTKTKPGVRFSPDYMHGLVKRWTRNFDIFENDFIVIPINENSHWFVAIICFAGRDSKEEKEDRTVKEKVVYRQAFDSDEFVQPCILIFESLAGTTHPHVFINLRHYLTQEWALRKRTLRDRPPRIFNKSNMKGCYPKLPQQNNGCDGGIFLLQNVESFFTRNLKSFRMPIHLQSWYTLEYVSKKREYISNLITNLASNGVK